MSSLNSAVTLTNGTSIFYVLNSVLRVVLIQSIFKISTSDLYLEDLSNNIYFPNSLGEFPKVNRNILMIRPAAKQIIPETIIVNYTDGRYLHDYGDYNPINDCLEIGYNAANKYIIRSLIKFDQLESLKGKKSLKAYLYITGRIRPAGFNADPKEVFFS